MKMTHVIVEGLVQGVSFRESTRRKAFALNLAGWVRNRRDGTVEALFAGADGDMAAMLEWLKQGPPRARVDNLIVKTLDAGDPPASFEIRFDSW